MQWVVRLMILCGWWCACWAIKCDKCMNLPNELNCPDLFDPDKLVIKFDNHKNIANSRIHVTCKADSPYFNASLLEGCGFGSVRYVMFQHCPLPDETFSEVLTLMGVVADELITLSFNNARQRFNQILRADHLQGLTGLKNVEFKNNLFTEIPEGFFNSTPNLEFLNFIYNNLTALPETLFANTPNLTLLNLWGNELTALPDLLFAEIPLLSRLSLFDNKLREIQPQLLEHVPALTKLELSVNELTQLPPTLLTNLDNLTSLNINSNSIEQLPENLLHNCAQLKYVYMTKNKLISLPAALFKVSKGINELSFEDNLITNLPEGLFSGMQNLTKLLMKRNAIKSFDNNIFTDLVNLEILDLQSNLIPTLPPGCFRNQRKMYKLVLQNNSLTELPDNIFQHCEDLEELYLGHNNLSVLLPTSFPHPTSVLTNLQLSHNNLTFTTHSLHRLSHHNLTSTTPAPDQVQIQEQFPLSSQTHLVELSLDHNHIASIPRALTTDFPEMAQLDLSGNLIEFLEDADVYFKQEPISIDLSQNQIRTVGLRNQEIPWSGEVLRMKLAGNPLLCDCHLYRLATIMQQEMNRPTWLPRFVHDAQKVTCIRENGSEEPVLKISSKTLTCAIPICPKSCSCATRAYDQMFMMDCSHRGLLSVPQLSHTELQQLIGNHSLTLNIQSNNISSLAGLQQYTMMVNLMAANNSISNVKESFLPTSLQALDLRGNQLTYLEEPVLKFLNATNIILSLGQNPWLCDCQLLPLFAFLRDPVRNVTDTANMACGQLKVPLVKILEEDLCPIIQRPLVIAGIASTTILLVIFVVIGTVMIYRHQHDIKVWLYTHRLLLWVVAQEEEFANKKYDAFISYSVKDEIVVNEVLVPGLELADPKYRTCLPYRDWTPGEQIQKQIDQSIEDSKRTIVVLSNNFIENVWGQIEFKTAHSKALKDKTNRIIVIVLGEVPPESQMDEELKLYLSTRTYLQYGDTKFWEKLRYAMPHPQQFVYRRHKKYMNEKLEKTEKIEMGQPEKKICV